MGEQRDYVGKLFDHAGLGGVPWAAAYDDRWELNGSLVDTWKVVVQFCWGAGTGEGGYPTGFAMANLYVDGAVAGSSLAYLGGNSVEVDAERLGDMVRPLLGTRVGSQAGLTTTVRKAQEKVAEELCQVTVYAAQAGRAIRQALIEQFSAVVVLGGDGGEWAKARRFMARVAKVEGKPLAEVVKELEAACREYLNAK
jgi:hypothetical protein